MIPCAGVTPRGGYPPPACDSCVGGVTRGEPRRAQYYTQMGGGTPPKPPVLLRGGTRGHMYENRSWGVGGISVNSFLIGTGGGVPPPSRQSSSTTTGGYPSPHQKAPLLLPRGGVPPPLRLHSVLVVKEKRPSGTSETLVSKFCSVFEMVNGICKYQK